MTCSDCITSVAFVEHERYPVGRSTPRVPRLAASALAGVAAAELVAMAMHSTGPIDGAARFVVDTVPVPVVETTVRMLGRFDKDATRLGVLASVCVAGAAIDGRRSRPFAIVGLSTLGALLAVRRPPRRTSAVVLGALAGATTALVSDRAPVPVPLATIGAAVALVVRKRRRAARAEYGPLPSLEDGAEKWGCTTPLITPTASLYVTDVNLGPPQFNRDRHVLEIRGAVERPLNLHVDELREIASVPFASVLVCIHNRVGGERIGNVMWQGAELDRIIDLVKPTPEARFVSTVAVDGFRATMPLATFGDDGLGGWVVFAMNGAELTPSHGGPVRFLVPGLYGQYNGAKWLSRLEFLQRHPGDYWTPRGWAHGPMPVRVGSRLDAPRVSGRTATLTGVAWAPPHGIDTVHILVNGQAVPAMLADEVDPRSWRRFRAEVELGPGRHRIQAQATSALGVEQSDDRRPPFPTGATGLHTIEVRIP